MVVVWWKPLWVGFGREKLSSLELWNSWQTQKLLFNILRLR